MAHSEGPGKATSKAASQDDEREAAYLAGPPDDERTMFWVNFETGRYGWFRTSHEPEELKWQTT